MSVPRPAGLILAAGRSSRMGEPKALIHLGGRTILESVAEAFLAARLDPVVIVASGETLASARAIEGVVAVEGDPSSPMIDSVIRGLGEIGDEVLGVVVQPVDAAFTTAEMIVALTAGDPSRSSVLCHQGRPGHPVMLARASFEEVLERPDGGLRAVLAMGEVELVEWPDARVLADLDTPEDVARWRAALGQGLN